MYRSLWPPSLPENRVYQQRRQAISPRVHRCQRNSELISEAYDTRIFIPEQIGWEPLSPRFEDEIATESKINVDCAITRIGSGLISTRTRVQYEQSCLQYSITLIEGMDL